MFSQLLLFLHIQEWLHHLHESHGSYHQLHVLQPIHIIFIESYLTRHISISVGKFIFFTSSNKGVASFKLIDNERIILVYNLVYNS